MIVFRGLKMLVLIVLLALGQTAFGHGFQLSLVGNQLVGTGDDFLEAKTTNPSTYSSAWTNASAGTLYNKGAGGVQPSASGGLSVANGDTFSLEFLGPLKYSNGGAATPAAVGVGLVANSYVGTSYTLPNLIDSTFLNGSLVLPDLLDVSGNSSHSIQWLLSGSPIPAGVYGFAYRVHGQNSVTHSTYAVSSPLVALLNTPDFTNATEVAAARSAVYSAVPEPNTAALAIAGLAVLVCLVGRTQGRQTKFIDCADAVRLV